MHRTRPFRTVRRRAGLLAALAATLLATTATAAPAAFALPAPPMAGGDATPPPAVQTVRGGRHARLADRPHRRGRHGIR